LGIPREVTTVQSISGLALLPKLSSWGTDRHQYWLLLTDKLLPFVKNVSLRIFQRFRLVKFIEKFKTRVKNLEIEKIIAIDKYLHEVFFAFYFNLSKNLFLTLKSNEVADLTHFSTKCGCF